MKRIPKLPKEAKSIKVVKKVAPKKMPKNN